ncbi:DUF1963 domain-containing protein [Deinococcus aestuarii]|uniref:DUF1963 domain-containing protein n=1 Tax=Deinococcus aestuarii TaxID=2774531 RepID=UPI001C0D4D0F|nr:DUF1963 domain-containing protein [Deinococcus aestuarii]
MTNLPATHAHLRLPEFPKVLEPRREWLEANVRPAWLLRAVESQSIQEGDSFLGGNAPYLPEGEAWPTCPHCTREMGFVMQVNLAPFVGVLKFVQPGTFQFWNCWYCLPSGDAYADARQLRTHSKSYRADFISYGSSSHLARWYVGKALSLGTAHGAEQNYSGPILLSPEPYLSLPHPFDDGLDGWDSEEIDVYWEVSDQYWNRETISQVGGYPSWMQDGTTPRDPTTGEPTAFALALGTGDTGVIWGDTGFYYFFASNNGDLSEPFVLEQTT